MHSKIGQCFLDRDRQLDKFSEVLVVCRPLFRLLPQVFNRIVVRRIRRQGLHRDSSAVGLQKLQIPPDLVVKSQDIDIIGLILPLIRGQNVVETSRRHMKSRFELLSPSKGNWFTTKSDGMWERL